MFIPKFILETLFSAIAAHREGAARVAHLEAENARLKASCDWLAQHVSELKVERSMLFERVLQVQLPVFEVARQEAREIPARDLPPEMTPEALKSMAARFVAPMSTGEKGQVYRPTAEEPLDVALAESQAAMSIFEDMGDERAAKAGAGWSETGELAFSK